MIYLYQASVPEFIEFVQKQEFSSQLEQEFRRKFDEKTQTGEVTSWANSLPVLARVLDDNRFRDSYILLEFKMPTNSARCDVILTGKSQNNLPTAVVLELKQWQYATASAIRNHVLMGRKDRLHPSAQVKSYCESLRYYHQAFTMDGFNIYGCAYLHNLDDKKTIGVLNDPSLFSSLAREFPVFANEALKLRQYLADRIGQGEGKEIAAKLVNGGVQPSTKLLDVVAQVINQDFQWRLGEDQLDAFDTVVSRVESLKNNQGKAVIIVQGGPGTGKSVLAIQLLAYAARHHWRVAHATGSKAFITVLDAKTQHLADAFLRDVFGVRYKRELPVGQLFSTFANIAQIGASKENEFDLVIGDEAHRLWDYRRRKYRGMNKQLSETPMIEEIVRAAKVTVFFLDDKQSVRANEIGTADYIQQQVSRIGINWDAVDLVNQYRCLGSKSYLNWVDAALNFGAQRSLSWKKYDGYDFRIMNSIQEMERVLDGHRNKEYTGRMVAGFCWKWSLPEAHGGLVHDVADSRFEGWSAPWIEKTELYAKSHSHRYYKWALDESFAKQVGSIYSVQGFEFDYVGVIFGEDLVIRDNMWVSDLNENKDTTFKRELKETGEDPVAKLRNIYRVLLTRGMQGTYVYFLDEETRLYFERMLAEENEASLT